MEMEYPWCMPRQAQPISLGQADRLELQRWVAAHGTPQQVAQRCQIILSAAEGLQDKTIAADLQINFKTVALWRGRFRSEGTDCLWEVAAGRGRKPHYSDEKSKLLLTPHYKLAPQEPRTGVAEPWLSNKVSARTRLIGCGRVISSNPTFRKLSNCLVMRSFWRS
jgi:hypothetical protein